jgi:hypothetical protein
MKPSRMSLISIAVISSFAATQSLANSAADMKLTSKQVLTAQSQTISKLKIRCLNILPCPAAV